MSAATQERLTRREFLKFGGASAFAAALVGGGFAELSFGRQDVFMVVDGDVVDRAMAMFRDWASNHPEAVAGVDTGQASAFGFWRVKWDERRKGPGGRDDPQGDVYAYVNVGPDVYVWGGEQGFVKLSREIYNLRVWPAAVDAKLFVPGVQWSDVVGGKGRLVSYNVGGDGKYTQFWFIANEGGVVQKLVFVNGDRPIVVGLAETSPTHLASLAAVKPEGRSGQNSRVGQEQEEDGPLSGRDSADPESSPPAKPKPPQPTAAPATEVSPPPAEPTPEAQRPVITPNGKKLPAGTESIGGPRYYTPALLYDPCPDVVKLELLQPFNPKYPNGGREFRCIWNDEWKGGDWVDGTVLVYPPQP